MATYTGAGVSENRTLSGTTVDTATMTLGASGWLVGNWVGTADLWVTYTQDGSTPTTPTVGLAGAYRIPPGTFKLFRTRGGIKIKVLGNGNEYSIEADER